MPDNQLRGMKIAILVADGFEQMELIEKFAERLQARRKAGAA